MLDIHIRALGIDNVGITSECFVVVRLLHVRYRMLSNLRLILLEFRLNFVSNFVHLVFKGHLAWV